MKRFIAALLVAAAATVSGLGGSACAQVFGQLTTAEILPLGTHMAGGYVHFSSNQVGLLAQLRLSLHPGIDFGFMGGLSRYDQVGDEVNTVRMGADVKFALLEAGEASSMDLSLGGAIGLETGNDVNITTVGPYGVLSRAFPVGERAALAPYGGLGLLFSNVDVAGFEDADFAFPIRLGCEFRFAPEFRVGTELQLRVGDDFNDDVAFVTGVNLPF